MKSGNFSILAADRSRDERQAGRKRAVKKIKKISGWLVGRLVGRSFHTPS